MGIVPSALGGTRRGPDSLDWLMLLKAEHIVLVRCKGLRNAPSVGIECRPVRKIFFSADLSESLALGRLVSASMSHPGTYDDAFTFMGVDTRETNLVKCSVQLKPGSVADSSCESVMAQLNSVVRVNPGASLQISQIVPHPSLPLLALVYGAADLLQIYKLEEQDMQPSVHEPSFSLHGSFRCGKYTQRRHDAITAPSRRILDAQWVNDMD